MDKNMEIKRINIRLPEYIQDWYKSQGEKYSVPYTNYMALLLTQYYEKEKDRELVNEFNNTLKNLQSKTGDVTVDEMLKEMREMMAKLQDIENQSK